MWRSASSRAVQPVTGTVARPDTSLPHAGASDAAARDIQTHVPHRSADAANRPGSTRSAMPVRVTMRRRSGSVQATRTAGQTAFARKCQHSGAVVRSAVRGHTSSPRTSPPPDRAGQRMQTGPRCRPHTATSARGGAPLFQLHCAPVANANATASTGICKLKSPRECPPARTTRCRRCETRGLNACPQHGHHERRRRRTQRFPSIRWTETAATFPAERGRSAGPWRRRRCRSQSGCTVCPAPL